MTTDPQSYRRRHRVTRITERRVVRTVTGVRRRILWRLRELSAEAGRTVTIRECMRAVGCKMSKSSLWHTVARSRMDRETFDMLTAALRMDEVDGWDRPWPALPPASERRSLAEVIRDELTAGGPGKG